MKACLRHVTLQLLTGLAVALAVLPAWAVVVFETGRKEPIRGFLIEQDAQKVVIDEVTSQGKLKRREIPRSSVSDLIISVDAQRLSALRHDRPQDYRDYAEELAAKKIDPEAQQMSLRLFHIAAYLDPAKLGRGALRAMANIARDAREERKFRALAYLLDDEHDRSVLVAPSGPPADGGAAKGKVPEDATPALLAALRFLRRERRADALRIVERPGMREQFSRMDGAFTYEEFVQACNYVCPDCTKGYNSCEACGGTGRRKVVDRFVTCGQCKGGKVVCPTCRTRYREVTLPREIVLKTVLAELALHKAAMDSVAQPGAAAREVSWSQLTDQEPVPALDLLTLTEFDPRKCHYRDGQWVAPDGAKVTR
jgi:hypothetical protein